MIKNQSIIKTNEFLVKLSFFCIAFRFEITSVCVFIMFVLSLYEIIKNKINIFKKLNFTILFFFLYFAVDLIGILYSENKSFGFKDLESKLFFLIVPIIFLSNKFKIEIIYKSLKYFIVGTSILLMIHYLQGFLYFLKFDSIPNYVYFSYHIHPTYFSIYLLISIILLLKLKNNLAISINWMYYFFLIMLSFGIILSNSKAGTLTFLIYLSIEIIKFLLKQKKIYLITSLSVLIFISIIIFQKIENSRFSELKTSFNFPYQTEYNGVYNSTQIRIIIWRSVKEIIHNKPFFGTGTGDIKDELKNEFIKIKFQNGIENKYNCHNQYFQIIATFGYVLGLPILIMYGYSIYRGIKSKNLLFVLLNLIIIFNLVFESMLESKAGIEFIVIFFVCFSLYNTKSTFTTFYPIKNNFRSRIRRITGINVKL
jgi:O-antigen ligase